VNLEIRKTRKSFFGRLGNRTFTREDEMKDHTRYVVDAYAWIEYWTQSQRSRSQRPHRESSEHDTDVGSHPSGAC